MLDQVSVNPIVDQLRYAAMIPAYARTAITHRLEVDEAKPLTAARQGEHIGRLELFMQFGIRDRSGEADGAVQAQRCRLRSQSRQIVSAAHNRERDWCARRPGVVNCRYQCVETFVGITGNEASDAQYVEAVFWTLALARIETAILKREGDDTGAIDLVVLCKDAGGIVRGRDDTACAREGFTVQQFKPATTLQFRVARRRTDRPARACEGATTPARHPGGRRL